MCTTTEIPDSMKREYFAHDVKHGRHPRYGKNASWDNYKHPDTPVGQLGPKTFWYAYETCSGKIGVMISLKEGMFGPAVHCFIDPAGKKFEEAVYEFWCNNSNHI